MPSFWVKRTFYPLQFAMACSSAPAVHSAGFSIKVRCMRDLLTTLGAIQPNLLRYLSVCINHGRVRIQITNESTTTSLNTLSRMNYVWRTKLHLLVREAFQSIFEQDTSLQRNVVVYVQALGHLHLCQRKIYICNKFSKFVWVRMKKDNQNVWESVI